MIKNIVFDLGDVLITGDGVGILDSNEVIKKRFNVNFETLLNAWRKNWSKVGLGKISIIEFYSNIQKDITGQIDLDFSKELFEIYKKETHLLDAFNLLPVLKRNYRLFSITNIFKEGYEFKKEKYKLHDLFEIIIASNEVHMLKPNPEIFKTLVDKSNIRPEESLFIDDMEKNTNAAAALGFKTHVFRDVQHLKAEFNKLKIKYD